jgi:NAD/NADP transhydrogenase beta subunit
LALPGPATVAHSGAGDIVNPAADDDTTSPIAGIQTMLDEVLVALEG